MNTSGALRYSIEAKRERDGFKMVKNKRIIGEKDEYGKEEGVAKEVISSS